MSSNQNSLVGIDKLGRKVEAVRYEDNGKQVGCFFWMWIGQPYASGVWDATEILKRENGAGILYHQDNKEISPDGQAHWWGKPLWGYYNSDDKWVIRKQLEMLASAGVDFIYFDATNTLTYPNVYLRIMEAIHEMLQEGSNPPKCAFYTHTHSIATMRTLYRDLYSKGLYSDTWYRVDGKPFIIAFESAEADMIAEEITMRRRTSYNPGPLEPEIKDFFYFRRPQWPTNDTVYPDGFPWVEWIYPQPIHTDVMNVTVGSHPNVPMSFTRTRGLENWGRGWDPEKKVNVPEKCEEGSFFQLQWDNAIANRDKLKTVSVGGWNEWIAYKQLYDGEYMLCDAADMELSRDIEPMEGGYEDNFYLQLIRNVRRFKEGDKALAAYGVHKKCDIEQPASFEGAQEYSKVGQKPFARCARGCTRELRYEEPAARNTLNRVRAANDSENIWFALEAYDGFKPYSVCDNTCLYIGTGTPEDKGYYSYEYMLRRTGKEEMTLYRLNAAGEAEEAGRLECRCNEGVLTFAVKRSIFGDCRSIYFKATDSVVMDDIMKTYTTGSAMPMGRLSYLYELV